jgi:hypothetical protein
MNFYTQLVRIEPPQAEPTIQAPLSSMSAPRPATATGGDATTDTLQPLSGKSLFDNSSGVVSASGPDLGYARDLQATIHPIGVDDKPSEVGFTIVVHVVSEYASEEVLLGTQKQMLWRM